MRSTVEAPVKPAAIFFRIQECKLISNAILYNYRLLSLLKMIFPPLLGELFCGGDKENKINRSASKSMGTLH